MPEKLPRFVEFLRVSSAGQAEKDTPADQRRDLDRLRASRPGVFVERIDIGARGLSGAKGLLDRPDLLRLEELSRARAYDELRVRNIGRLTRHPDPRERFAIYGMVLDAGAVIVDAGGHVIDPASDAGELEFGIKSWAYARDRKEITERARAAKDRLAAMGRLVSSWPPVGRTFSKKTGEWGTEPEGMARGRRIFALFLEPGMTTPVLAERLNAEGIPTPSRRGVWHSANLRQFLTKPTAIGIYTTHGHTFSIPPLVDKQTFDAAQAKLKANRWKMSGRPAAALSEVLLRKLLVCGVCGCTMYADRGGTKQHSYIYYLCSAGDAECRTYHRAEAVDRLVKDRVRAFVERPDVLLAAKPSDAEESDPDAELATANAALRKVEQRAEKLVRLTTKGLVPEKVGIEQLKEIQRDREQAERLLSDAQARKLAASQRAANLATVRDSIDALRRRLRNASPEAWRAVIASLFPRGDGGGIRIYPDGKIELRGLLTLGDAGAEQVQRRGKRAGSSGRSGKFPLRLDDVVKRPPRRASG